MTVRDPLQVSLAPWREDPQRRLEHKRSISGRQYKFIRSNLESHYPDTVAARKQFKVLEKLVENLTTTSQISTEQTVFSQLKTNPRLFHFFIYHRKVNRPSIYPLRTQLGAVTNEQSEFT